MKTDEAIKLAGSRSALAELLGITLQAIYGWGEALPEQRVWQLMTLRPDWFDADSPGSRAEIVRRADREARIDRILQMAEEIRREVLAWRNS